MPALAPLKTLFELDRPMEIALPSDIAALYGRLCFPPHPGRPYVIGNFVSTLDGVVSLNIPGHSGGAEISGHNEHDRMVMGLLRAISDAVIVGAGTLRSVPQHLWTAEYIYPPLAPVYSSLRARMEKTGRPLNVIVTGSGLLDLRWPVFNTDGLPVLIVTTAQGARLINAQRLPGEVEIEAVKEEQHISAASVLDAIHTSLGHEIDLALVEGGPQLLGDFIAEDRLDELFLTLAPQIAGREKPNSRPALVEGKLFAPEHSVWGELVAVKQGSSHLFLRYALSTAAKGR